MNATVRTFVLENKAIHKQFSQTRTTRRFSSLALNPSDPAKDLLRTSQLCVLLQQFIYEFCAL
jgi:hypothetical protein